MTMSGSAASGATTTTTTTPTAGGTKRMNALNSRWHKPALITFGVIVAWHWLEHIVQAWQIWGEHKPKPKALGLVGAWYPWLIKTEWLHYGFALVMLVFLALLLPGFSGRARTFWMVALGIQVWHFIEHQILSYQALTHHNWWHSKVPVSILQHYWFPGSRPELHLFYNSLVTIPMLIGMYFHMYPPPQEDHSQDACTCARHAERVPTMAPVAA